jgi:16S rRNA processing protein RimM
VVPAFEVATPRRAARGRGFARTSGYKFRVVGFGFGLAEVFPEPGTRKPKLATNLPQLPGQAGGRTGGAAVTPNTLIALGYVVGPHATRGELRVRPFNPDSTTLQAGCTVVLRHGPDREERRVTAVRRHKHYLLVTLHGCDSMNAAEALKGRELCVHEADLPQIGPDEIYHYELVGMTVITAAGADVGTVVEVMATPGNDICVVRAGDREHLIPLVDSIVTQIDRQQRRLVIDPPLGLLDAP